jgi:hypothetical protein
LKLPSILQLLDVVVVADLYVDDNDEEEVFHYCLIDDYEVKYDDF